MQEGGVFSEASVHVHVETQWVSLLHNFSLIYF